MAPPLNLSDDQLRRIKSPTLLMLGERDNVFGRAWDVAERARRLTPQAQVEIISEAGHMMNTDSAEFVNMRLLRFLQE